MNTKREREMHPQWKAKTPSKKNPKASRAIALLRILSIEFGKNIVKSSKLPSHSVASQNLDMHTTPKRSIFAGTNPLDIDPYPWFHLVCIQIKVLDRAISLP